jgi:hypothetical protein
VRASGCKHRYQYESLFHYRLRVVHSSSCTTVARPNITSFVTTGDFIHMIPPITDEPSRYGSRRRRSIDELINQTVRTIDATGIDRSSQFLFSSRISPSQMEFRACEGLDISFVKHPRSTSGDPKRTSHQHATHLLRVAFVGHSLAPNALEQVRTQGSLRM